MSKEPYNVEEQFFRARHVYMLREVFADFVKKDLGDLTIVSKMKLTGDLDRALRSYIRNLPDIDEEKAYEIAAQYGIKLSKENKRELEEYFAKQKQ